MDQPILHRPRIEPYTGRKSDRQEIVPRPGHPVSVTDLILALRVASPPMPRHRSPLTPEDLDWLHRWLSQAPDRGDVA